VNAIKIAGQVLFVLVILLLALATMVGITFFVDWLFFDWSMEWVGYSVTFFAYYTVACLVRPIAHTPLIGVCGTLMLVLGVVGWVGLFQQ